MVRILEVKQGTIRITRDVVLFVMGAAGIFHETVFTRQERPVLIILFAAMVGLTGVIRSTEIGVSRDEQENRE